MLPSRYRLAMLALPLLVSCKWIPGTDAQKIDVAQQVVADMLKNPTSPMFTELRAAPGGVCGYVNAKNGFGAYSGKSKFVVQDGGSAIIEGLESENSGITATNMCELERLYSACQAGTALLSASIGSTKECNAAGMQAIENQFGLPSGTLPRMDQTKTKK